MKSIRTIQKNAKYALKAKQKREEHRSKGLCATGCGQPLYNKWQCEECSKKSSFNNNRVRNKKRLELIKKGICSNDNCGKPLATKWLCRECQDKCNKYAKNWFNKDRIGNLRKINEHTRRYRFGGLRDKIVERDNNICQICFRKEYKICVHHINEDPKDNRMDNLVCLCRQCHMIVEMFNARKPDIRRFFYWFRD